MTALRTLANDTTFHSNLRTAIAETLGAESSTVAIKSVTVGPDGKLHVEYEVVYASASAAAAAQTTLNQAAAGTGTFASGITSQLATAVTANPPTVTPVVDSSNGVA